MSAKNKVRGNVLEVETVKMFESHGISAKRAWGSNGASMGEHAEVDVLVTPIDNSPLKIQCKRKKELPDWLGFTKNIDAVVVREDRGRKFIMFDLEDFIERFLK